MNAEKYEPGRLAGEACNRPRETAAERMAWLQAVAGEPYVPSEAAKAVVMQPVDYQGQHLTAVIDDCLEALDA